MALDMIGGTAVAFPDQSGLYCGGSWHDAQGGGTQDTASPSTGRSLGAPFGGYKQSGLGREESLDELLDSTQIKNVNIALDQAAPAHGWERRV